MLDNADLFLGTFNEVEKFLKNNYNQGKHASFRFLLVKASKTHPIIKKFKNDLITYGDLRNAIMHNFNKDGEAIAVPKDKVVNHFAQIWEQIRNPQKVDVFFKNVHTCNIDASLKEALTLIHQYKILQIPIIEDNRIVDVLNSLQIVEWMAGLDDIRPSKTIIRGILSNSKNRQNYAIIPSDFTVFQAAEMYKESYKRHPKNRYFDALLITKEGKHDKPLLGIIVLKDIAAYLN
jgi:CBS domain-containing protein